MAEARTVYLDHLIRRESLRYRRPGPFEPDESQDRPQMLRMSDLLLENHPSSWVDMLRKPDFQRATSAWTSEDCFSLLDSVVNDQTVPSIIMWSSQDSKLLYILDGGHRISVILAWMRDDWGDKCSPDQHEDMTEYEQYKETAKSVRELVTAKIGSFLDHQEAGNEVERIQNEGKSDPKTVLGVKVYRRAQFYN